MTHNDVIIRALKRTCGAKFRSYLAYKELCALLEEDIEIYPLFSYLSKRHG